MLVFVSVEHWEQVRNMRVNDVMADFKYRPEPLLNKPPRKFEPDPGVIWEITVPEEKNRFTTIEEALAAVNVWCR